MHRPLVLRRRLRQHNRHSQHSQIALVVQLFLVVRLCLAQLVRFRHHLVLHVRSHHRQLRVDLKVA